MEKFIVRHVQPQEFPIVAELVTQVFRGSSQALYEQHRHYWQNRLHAPGFDYAAHRVGVLSNDVSERIVSHTEVYPYTLRYGSVTLRVAGVGGVCTHPDFRHNGYNSAVMHDSLAYMAEQGAHLALLNGISGFYMRFGFSSVFPNYFFEVESESAAKLPMPLRLRPPAPRDIPYMAALYQKHWAGRVTLTRSAELWLWRVTHDAHSFIQVVEDQRGRLCGYLAAPYATAANAEVLADNMDAALTLLADAGRRYQQAGAQISWLLPPDDALVYYARQALPVRVSAVYQPDGGWMARIIDTEALVSALLPELIAQAHTTMPELKTSALEFACQPDVVQIGLKGKPAARSRLSHQDFIQMMFGSLRPSMLALRSAMSHEAVHLLETLFPPRMAAVASWDWF